ncbi:MAG: TolC family protein [Candidatus Thiodiazotropha sp.]
MTRFTAVLLLLLLTGPAQSADRATAYSLDQAISVALENNRLRTISQQALAVAEAQYQQAASSYWPTVNFTAGFQRRDEPATFEYPAQQFDVMPGMLPPVNIPAQEIELLGRDTSTYSLGVTYPLYTGGKRSSLIEQAKIGVRIADREVHRTNLQVVQDVKRYYYAALYTQQLTDLADDITLSFEVLRDITRTFYEGGSNSVNKLDLLRSQLAHSMAEATLAELKSKHDAALAALSFAMGLDWREQIRLADERYPDNIDANSLDRLIDQALNFNPEIEKMTLAVQAYEAKVDEANSGYYPSLALVGSYDAFANDLDGGLDTEANNRSWMIGIGLKINLFEGGRTKHKVSAARSEQAKMEQQRLLVNDAIAMQVKNLFLQTQAAQNQIAITEQSLATSEQNRDLTGRAYQTGAVDTQKVIEADLFDAMIRANHYRARHDQALHLAEISYLLGKEATE